MDFDNPSSLVPFPCALVPTSSMAYSLSLCLLLFPVPWPSARARGLAGSLLAMALECPPQVGSRPLHAPLPSGVHCVPPSCASSLSGPPFLVSHAVMLFQTPSKPSPHCLGHHLPTCRLVSFNLCLGRSIVRIVFFYCLIMRKQRIDAKSPRLLSSSPFPPYTPFKSHSSSLIRV